MNLTEKFHKMEAEFELFDIGKDEDNQLWDILRYHVFIRYLYPQTGLQRLSSDHKRKRRSIIRLIKEAFKIFFKFINPLDKSESIILTTSRSVNSNGKYYDKAGSSIIEILKNKIIVLEALASKKCEYNTYYDFSFFYRRLYKSKFINLKDYKKIEVAINSEFGQNNFTLKEANKVYHNFQADNHFYTTVFKLKNLKSIFICLGNPKAQIKAAKANDMESFLVQHGVYDFDEIHISYPERINSESNVLFCDKVLTYGTYWGKGINIPTKEILSIGNNFYNTKLQLDQDNTIIVVSTIIHGEELKYLTKKIARTNLNQKFVFKLHPNEYQFKDDYLKFFRHTNNVIVVTNEEDIQVLISKAQLIVLIASTVIYEALHLCKKVAVYKKLNYYKHLNLIDIPNVYFFEEELEINQILGNETIEHEISFYDKLDEKLVLSFVNNNN